MPCTNFVASGVIAPAVFVKISGDDELAQATNGDMPFAISGPGQKFAPIDYGSSYTPPTEAADEGDPLLVYTEGEMCSLTLGVGGCSAGNPLKPDGAGQGIVASNTTNDAYGAIALQAGNAGDQVKVMVHLGRGT